MSYRHIPPSTSPQPGKSQKLPYAFDMTTHNSTSYSAASTPSLSTSSYSSRPAPTSPNPRQPASRNFGPTVEYRPTGSASSSSRGSSQVGPAVGYSDFGPGRSRDGSVSSQGYDPRSYTSNSLTSPLPIHTTQEFTDDPDDYLHDMSTTPLSRSMHGRASSNFMNSRALVNIGCLAILGTGIFALFAGYPIISATTRRELPTNGAYNLGGINATGQVTALIGQFSLVDKDTPESAYYHKSLETGEQWELVFSDEFDTEGRSFYPGDDPFWEAEDYHYWSTNNLEWYEPRRITTVGGKLQITLTNQPSHGLDYEGGIINTWNKFCFRGGYVETSVSLPGRSDVYGLWPAVWTLGNLGRAAYGGTLDGMWPYSYDTCDVGTLKNQTMNGLPVSSTNTGPTWDPYSGDLSYLPGQRLSSCTCPDDPSHPGPRRADGSFVGRSAPEIDVIEAQVKVAERIGEVSQSAQWAPFDTAYRWNNLSSNYLINEPEVNHLNSYLGGVYQQATSVVVITDQDCYEGNTGCFSIYGFEYAPGDKGYIRWVSDAKESWQLRAEGLGPNPTAEIGGRPVPYEPMYLIINLGISPNFGPIDFVGLQPLWPVHLLVDYIRVYQDPNNKMIGCDPPDMPTAAYIEKYNAAYTNPNITTFDDINMGPAWPKNRLIDTC